MKTNVHLANFMKASILEDQIIWWFEDTNNKYLHMDFCHKDSESEYWIKAKEERISWRTELFAQYPELLPKAIQNEMRISQAQKPINRSINNNRQALQGNAVLVLMLGRTGVSKILQDANIQGDQAKGRDIELDPELKEKFMSQPEDQKMQQYERMGTPNIKRR